MRFADLPTVKKNHTQDLGGVLVHEWIAKSGGSERVLAALAAVLNSPDIYCLWNEDPASYRGHRVRESILARTPLSKHKALALPTMPLVWRTLSGGPYDWVVASTHLFAHHVKFRQTPNIEKFIYVHTPARYLWAPAIDKRASHRGMHPITRGLRHLDRVRAQEATRVAANSAFIQKRIEKCWERDSSIIYPPVEVKKIMNLTDDDLSLNRREEAQLQSLPSSFLLGASRLVDYKKLDTVIRAGEIADMPVVIAGDGPDRARLNAVAEGSTIPVVFLGQVSDQVMYSLFRRTAAYIFPPVEDFGIMPVEAIAAGASVVANAVGGTAESVQEGIGGSLCAFQTDEQIAESVDRALEIPQGAGRNSVIKFDISEFNESIKKWLPVQCTASRRQRNQAKIHEFRG